MRRIRSRIAALVSAGALGACASVLGIEDGVLDVGDGSVPDAGGDGTLASDGAEASADAGCASRTPDDAHGVFAATSGADLFDCGARGSPCQTVQKAIARAQTLGATTVYASQGTYFGQISLAAGIAVEGGWSTQWSPLCGASASSAVTLQAPSTSNATVIASQLGGTATLRTLTVASKAAADVGSGESLYGVVASGASTLLVLDGVVVQVAAGGDGPKGATGATGDGGSTMGCTAQDGANGGVGNVGDAGLGDFQSSGYVSIPGSGGGAGSPGNAGMVGGPGSCATCLLNGQDCFQAGGGGCPSPGTGTFCADAGIAGCGGAGGAGGGPGQGGGSSVALFVWGATVTCTSGALHAGSGGAGGAGGTGGTGGSGGEGLVGATASCTASCRPTGGGCVPGTPETLDGGAAGGLGGAGGPGGQGGGGAGGWSCAAYAGGDASVSLGAMSLSSAEAGAGGPPNGSPGDSKEQCP
jgi:hypothetical protein